MCEANQGKLPLLLHMYEMCGVCFGIQAQKNIKIYNAAAQWL